VTDATRTFQRTTVFVALLFVLGWGLPMAHATCIPSGPMAPEHCGGSEPGQHCDGEMGAASAVCLTHHASQEARTEQGPSVDPSTTGSGVQLPRSAEAHLGGATSSASSTEPAIQRVCRLHTHVGVWLE